MRPFRLTCDDACRTAILLRLVEVDGSGTRRSGYGVPRSAMASYSPTMRATDGTGQLGHTLPQHVWITTSSGVFPGLLLEWIRDGDSPWKGRVIWAEPGVTHQAVLDAKQISPFDRPGHQAQG